MAHPDPTTEAVDNALLRSDAAAHRIRAALKHRHSICTGLGQEPPDTITAVGPVKLSAADITTVLGRLAELEDDRRTYTIDEWCTCDVDPVSGVSTCAGAQCTACGQYPDGCAVPASE
jgi:hypothetical protein